MIDVLNEDLIDLREAAGLPPFRNRRTRKPAHSASIYRYAQTGAKASNGEKIRLETVKVPAGLVTSRQAVERFIRALTDPDADPSEPTPLQRRKQIDAARTRMAAAGCV